MPPPISSFTTPLELEYIDGRNWKITAEFDYFLVWGLPETICIPAGFVTDFASIPRLLWNLLPPTGSYGKAAVVHDWLYRHCGMVTISTPLQHDVKGVTYSRAECDEIFREAMEVLGVGWFTRQTIYRAVRMFGGSSYRCK